MLTEIREILRAYARNLNKCSHCYCTPVQADRGSHMRCCKCNDHIAATPQTQYIPQYAPGDYSWTTTTYPLITGGTTTDATDRALRPYPRLTGGTLKK